MLPDSVKRSSLILLLIIFLAGILSPFPAHADGMVIYRRDPYSNRFDFARESSQQAFISYSDGVEKMIVAIKADNLRPNSDMVWLLPVPAPADRVIVDIVDELPDFSGEEVILLAKSKLTGIRNMLLSTQIYPLPYVFFSSYILGTPGGINFNSSGPVGIRAFLPGTGAGQPDVQVYEHLEKEGMVTEIISAGNPYDLFNYFKSKNLNIETGSIPVLETYIGKDYSFVASWIDDTSSLSGYSDRGIVVNFPTGKIYFPLLPTSVYGSEIVPTSIRVLGHVTPDIYQDIKPYSRVRYYSRNGKFITKHYPYMPEVNNTADYTKIEIAAPSKLLTSDLFISRQAPFYVKFMRLLGNQSGFSAFLLIVILSVVSSLIWALVLFPSSRNLQGLKKYSLLGMANCLTLVGFFVALLFVKTRNITPYPDLISQLKQKGYYSRRRLAIIGLLFGPVIWILSFFAVIIFSVLMGSLISPNGFFDLLFVQLFFWPAVAVIPFMVIIGYFFLLLKLLKIVPSDQPLFDRLKEQKINTMTFVASDSRKLLFLPLFSVTFIMLSIITLKIAENTQAQEVNIDSYFRQTYPSPVQPRPLPRRPTIPPQPAYPSATPTPAVFYRSPTPEVIPNSRSATKPCPVALENGMCNLPNCSYSYPNDIYNLGYVVVGDKYDVKYGRPSGTFYDECSPDNTRVYEKVCGLTGEGDYLEHSANYDCPLGCEDGVCIQSPSSPP